MINLLNQEVQNKRSNDRKFRQLLVFFVILVFLALISWAVILIMEKTLQSRINSLSNQTSSVQASTLKFRDLEKNLTATNERLGQIDSLINARTQWSAIFANLSSLTPTSVQINNLSVAQVDISSKSDGVSQIQIAGSAKTLDDIEIYRKSLDGSGTFGNSVFKSASLDKEKNIFTFSLSTTVLKNKP